MWCHSICIFLFSYCVCFSLLFLCFYFVLWWIYIVFLRPDSNAKRTKKPHWICSQICVSQLYPQNRSIRLEIAILYFMFTTSANVAYWRWTRSYNINNNSTTYTISYNWINEKYLTKNDWLQKQNEAFYEICLDACFTNGNCFHCFTCCCGWGGLKIRGR